MMTAVKSFMVPLENIVKCSPEATVTDAARLITEKHIGSVLVVDDAA